MSQDSEKMIAEEIEAIKHSLWNYDNGVITQDLLIIQLGNSMTVIKSQFIPPLPEGVLFAGTVGDFLDALESDTL